MDESESLQGAVSRISDSPGRETARETEAGGKQENKQGGFSGELIKRKVLGRE